MEEAVGGGGDGHSEKFTRERQHTAKLRGVLAIKQGCIYYVEFLSRGTKWLSGYWGKTNSYVKPHYKSQGGKHPARGGLPAPPPKCSPVKCRYSLREGRFGDMFLPFD